jgi:hypothetical protein
LPIEEAPLLLIESMAKRIFTSSFEFIDGVRSRIEIVDLYGSGPNLDYGFEVAAPGYSINYSGSIDDISNPIQASGMSFSAYFTEARRDYLMGVLFAQKEFSLACAVYNYTPGGQEYLEWCGLVLPEETVEEISDEPILITFQCTDGLSTLKMTDFKEPDGDFYEGERPLIFFVFESLKKLPHWAYYFSGTTQEFLYEAGTPTSARTNLSLSNADDSSLATLFVHSRTFYESEKKPTGFRPLPQPSDTFSSTYSVLEDVMNALGSTLMMSRGAWWMINKPYIATLQDHASVKVFAFYNIQVEPYYEYYDFNHNFLIDMEDSKLEFSVGAARRGVYPFRGASQLHLGAGSDVIFRNGREYNFIRQEAAEGLIKILAQIYPFFKRYEITGVPIYDIKKPFQNNYDAEELAMWKVDKMARMRMPATFLNVEPGPSGTITFSASGILSFQRTGIVDDALCPILSFIIEAKSDTGVKYKLKRRVLTNNSMIVDVQNSVTPLADYNPKFYENQGAYVWVQEGQPGYSAAKLDCLICMDPEYVKEGSTERFLQTDYPDQLYYTPVRAKIKQTNQNSDNVLVKDGSDEKSKFEWQILHTIEMPEMESGFFEEIGIYAHELKVYRSNEGPLPTGTGAYTFPTTPSFYSATNPDGTGSSSNPPSNCIPTSYTLNGVHLYIGDGTDGFDINSLALNATPSGGEIKDLGSTRIGSTQTTATIGNGRLRAEFGTPGTRYDGLTWSPRDDEETTSSALHMLNCQEFMNIRHRVRQSVSGEVLRHTASDIVDNNIRPYNVLKTRKLSGSGDEYLMVASLSNNSDSFNMEALVCKFVRDAITEVDETKGPTRNPNGTNPNGTDVEIGPEGRLKQRLAVTEGKTDLIQVSVPITDENLGGGGDSGSSVIFSMFIGKAFNG